MRLDKWLNTFFSIHSIKGDEYLLTCPRCCKEKLYFNVSKRIGHCHIADCYYHVNAPKVEDLANDVGFEPDDSITFGPISDWVPTDVPTHIPVELPKGATPLVQNVRGKLYTHFPIVCEKVSLRGIPPNRQYQYNLHFDGKRVYIPIYFQGKMVSYLGRAAWWFENDIKPKYLYARGPDISKYLFNWDNVGGSKYIGIVENTFNAINYNSRYTGLAEFITSSFGSHLSRERAKLLARSKAESVAFLWDHGTSEKAEKAINMLKNDYGIAAAYGIISSTNQQPDCYNSNWVRSAFFEIHKAARSGTSYLHLPIY
jgi:hypothetical protein